MESSSLYICAKVHEKASPVKPVSLEGLMKIAQRFSAGIKSHPIEKSPGTKETILPSLAGLGGYGTQIPSTKVLGYYLSVMRD
jgi:hypothetical protein